MFELSDMFMLPLICCWILWFLLILIISSCIIYLCFLNDWLSKQPVMLIKNCKINWSFHRTMKKDRKYFLRKLSCGISRMKRSNSIEQLRGPKDSTEANQNERVRNICLSYDEIIPGSLEEQEFFSIELLPPSKFVGLCICIHSLVRICINSYTFPTKICCVYSTLLMSWIQFSNKYFLRQEYL